MRQDPLFIRFANRQIGPAEVIESFLALNEHKPSQEIAEKALKKLPDLSIFRKDFQNALLDLSENGISNKFTNYVNSYMKPSLLELVDDGGHSRVTESRVIIIKAADTPWIESIICYNLCLSIRLNGVAVIKRCPVCSKFFCHKTKYAKYCSDDCKRIKG